MKDSKKHKLALLTARKIRKIREKNGLTQEGLAAEAQIARSYYVDMENGKYNFSLSKLYQVAQSLRVEPGELCPTLKELDDILGEDVLPIKKKTKRK
jgi:transcriptional regulator with XRE-family HTH domain